MAKAKKTDSVSKSVAEVPKVDVEVVSDSTTKKSTPRAAKASKSVKDTVVLTKNEVVAAPVVCAAAAAAHEGGDVVLTETFSQFLGKLQTLASAMNALKTEFRTLEKKATRELKMAQKIKDKRKRKSGNRSPSGFVKPTLISDELAKFLSKPSGTEMARTEVTREINTYIRAHDLQDKTNGRKINPDNSLAALLKIGQGEELTYFNLQRYMSPHFAKANAKIPAADMQAAAAAVAV
jgi:upstream activation factor subunit UAF30